jgi:hypothetical protein
VQLGSSRGEVLMNVHPLQRNTVVGLTVTALLLAMPIGAHSSENWSNDRPVVQLEPNVVTGLIAWIVAKTGWVVQEPPPIRFVSQTQLDEMYCGGNSSSNDIHPCALYSNKSHMIYLPDKWNPNDLHDRSALLHELVHHLQALNNVKAKCLAAYEPQAFDLQFEWLREQGIQDPYNFLGINRLTILIISQCSN